MVESLSSPSTEQAGQQDDCKHHWRIASPSGESSTGVCKICGASREFQNYAYRCAPGLLRRPQSNNAASR